MRRKDKEIADRQVMDEILEKAEDIRVAMVDDGEPYLVALNYVYADGSIYIHSAKEGRKIDVIRKNSKVAFQADIDVAIVEREEASMCTTRYRSVFGTGRALLLDDRDNKIRALEALMKKHTGKTGFDYPEKALDAVVIIKIEIDSLTGKKSGF